MIERKNITKDQAEYAIENGEFSEEIIMSKKYVAVILTQSWCPYWKSLDMALGKVSKDRDDLEIDIYKLEYDQTEFFDEFLRFKEKTLKNRVIPYIRYYVDRELIAETNYITTKGFLEKFNLDKLNQKMK